MLCLFSHRRHYLSAYNSVYISENFDHLNTGIFEDVSKECKTKSEPDQKEEKEVMVLHLDIIDTFCFQ